ncbi:MAG: hypothetical protein DRR04_12350, partial [Gammaproteobacteria bacterium]
LAMGEDDSFVVTWESTREGLRSVRGRAFDASGNPVGGEFEVTNEAGAAAETPMLPRPAVFPDGNVVVGFSEESAAVETGALVQIFEPKGAFIFLNGFESGDATAWSSWTP